jgi:hypothetical protein
MTAENGLAVIGHDDTMVKEGVIKGEVREG